MFYKLLVLVAISLALVINVSVAHEEHIEVAFKDVTLKDVCANRQVPIISVSVAKKMIAELNADPTICHESYRQSIYELEPILMVTEGERICSERKFNQIADYHFRYVNPRKETYKLFDDLNHLPKVIEQRPLHAEKFDYTVQLDDYNQEILIPIAVQQFFKAWALQVSGMCKKALVDNLERAIQTSLTDEDLDIMDKFIKSDKEISSSTSKKSSKKSLGTSFSGIVYMPELEGVREEDDRMGKGAAVLDFTNDEQMNKFMHACKLRFKPIYSKLLLPIVRLAKLGYDYMGRQIESIGNKLEKDPAIRRWVALTSICEAHGEFELVESESLPVKMEPLVYEPTVSYAVDDNLWVKGAEALQKELDLIKARKSTGLRGIKYRLGVGGRKALAFLDPHQFAFYRRNQNTVANVLNFFSISWNMISVGVSLGGWGR